MNDTARLDEAAEWLQRLQTSPRDESLVQQWSHWCQSDPTNLAAFERIEAVWNALDSHELKQRRASSTPHQGPRLSRIPWTLAASVLLAIGLATATWWFLAQRNPASGDFQTQTAQVRTYRLDDGSTMTLGPESHAVVRYAPTIRHIIITQGQAYFDVAKDPSRPFTVNAADKKITALGTRFETRLVGETVSVAVTDGRVAISDASSTIASSSAAVVLTAGQQTIARVNGAIAVPTPSKATDPTAWRKGQLQYIDEPLSAVIADVNRYTERKLVLTEPALRDRLYTGTVYRDRIEDWVKALEEVFPLHAQKHNDQILLEQRVPPAAEQNVH